MIHLGLHTDNRRPLSLSFEAAVGKIAATGLKHIEFAVIHGQNFIQALGYDPGVSLQSNPRALRRFLDKQGLRLSQIDGAYPMMGPTGSSFGVQYVQQAVRLSQLGAWASKQSSPLESRFAFEKAVALYSAKFALGSVPRPPFWIGYRVVPQVIEFWADRPFRMHDRIEFRRAAPGEAWTKTRLYP